MRTSTSLFAALSPLVSVRFSPRSTSKSTRHTPTEFKPRISGCFDSFSYAAVPPHPAHLCSSNQPNYELYPSATQSCTTPSTAVTLCATSLPISTRLANVDDWIDFGYRVCAAAIAFEQSRLGRVNVGEDLLDPRRYRCRTYHQALNVTRRTLNTFSIDVNILSAPHRTPRGREREKSTFV